MGRPGAESIRGKVPESTSNSFGFATLGTRSLAMSRIVTFYSYKGGVGRTFALANIGVLLAQKGKRVLLMDWDLEAPGLDLYFREYLPHALPSDKGTVHLLHEASTSASADWRTHVLPIKVQGVDSLRL